MRIGILGTGDVGRVLGTGFLEAGHVVKIGSREPSKETVQAWLNESGHAASAGTFAEAAAFAEVAVVATLWEGTKNALTLAGPGNLAGKAVIDATNPLDFSSGMPPTLAIGHTDSGGERVQRWLPDARVVKAFNTVGNAHMVNPEFPNGPPDMFICGNDAQAKQTVTRLLETFGWSAIDVGGIESSRYLEPLAMLWILHMLRTDSADFTFKLLNKQVQR